MSGSGKRIEDFFASGDEFEEMLSSAERDANTSYAVTACQKWRQTWENHGMRAYMSNQQYANLRLMAGFSLDD